MRSSSTAGETSGGFSPIVSMSTNSSRKKRKSRLAEALASLTTPQPTEFGDEDDEFDDGTSSYARQMAAETEDLPGDEVDATAAGDSGLPMRSSVAPDIGDNPKYRGKTVSREQLLKEMQALSPSESDSDFSDSDDDSDGGSAGQNAAADASRTPASGDDSGDSSSDEDAADFGPAAEADDGETLATDDVQQQLERLEEEDALKLVGKRDGRGNELERAQHTKNQKQLWGQLFGVRMQLQTLNKVANRFPTPDVLDQFLDLQSSVKQKDQKQLASEIQDSVNEVRESAATLVENLLGIADHLVGNSLRSDDGSSKAVNSDGGDDRDSNNNSDSDSDSDSDGDGDGDGDGDANAHNDGGDDHSKAHKSKRSATGSSDDGDHVEALWTRVNSHFTDLLPKVYRVCTQQNRREEVCYIL